MRPSDVVCDMMAGIGPFAVPAAARGCRVYANDLNPQSAKWLRTNVQLNKVQRRVAVSAVCGREFVRGLLRVGSAAEGASDPGWHQFGTFSHVLMNLPASALDFLDVFVGAFPRALWRAPLPRIHCYCFSKALDPQADVIQRAEQVMGCAIPGATAHIVRDVAPSKLMLCVEFDLPESAWDDAAAAAEPGSAEAGSAEPGPTEPGPAEPGSAEALGEGSEAAEAKRRRTSSDD